MASKKTQHAPLHHCPYSTHPKELTQYYKLAYLLEKLCVSKSSIYDWIKEGSFPKPVSLGRHTSRWVSSEVNEWDLKRKADRNSVSI